jgi:hypothetical protein
MSLCQIMYPLRSRDTAFGRTVSPRGDTSPDFPPPAAAGSKARGKLVVWSVCFPLGEPKQLVDFRLGRE